MKFTDIVPANARKTWNMAERLPDSGGAVRVVCTTPGKKTVAERAMYFNGRDVGTDTVGAWAD
ncbi:MAG: hypothetical protein L6427_02150 [Actinomycetia bacterium]|nr:hypothetical protein [Actinomycetes bacterium]